MGEGLNYKDLGVQWCLFTCWFLGCSSVIKPGFPINLGGKPIDFLYLGLEFLMLFSFIIVVCLLSLATLQRERGHSSCPVTVSASGQIMRTAVLARLQWAQLQLCQQSPIKYIMCSSNHFPFIPRKNKKYWLKNKTKKTHTQPQTTIVKDQVLLNGSLYRITNLYRITKFVVGKT